MLLATNNVVLTTIKSTFDSFKMREIADMQFRVFKLVIFRQREENIKKKCGDCSMGQGKEK